MSDTHNQTREVAGFDNYTILFYDTTMSQSEKELLRKGWRIWINQDGKNVQSLCFYSVWP